MESTQIRLDSSLYDLMMEVAGALAGATAVRARSTETVVTPPLLLQLRGGLAESPGWVLVQAAEFDPEPLTVAAFRVRDVYGSPGLVAAMLELMASEQWLERRANGEYFLAEEGRNILERVRERHRRFSSQLEKRLAGELDEIYRLLTRLIDASLASADGQGRWCLEHSRHRAPDKGEPRLMQIRHYFDDFNAFRDDAHMAAFLPYEQEGQTWEAFSYVCGGKAVTLDAIYAELARRGYSRLEYAASLESLVERGWLSRDEQGSYAPTARGKSIRGEAERLTDQFFYAPWSLLSSEEVARVPLLLGKLRDRLNEIAQS